MSGVVHIAGIALCIDGHLRQRCAWCGALLIDHDLAGVAVQEGQPGPGTWAVNALVEVDGPVKALVAQGEDEPLPANSCARLDPAATS